MENNKTVHKTSIGGQALIEGVLMRGPTEVAIAVRKPNKEIDLQVQKVKTLGMRYAIFRTPFIRGMVSLIESLTMGTKALMHSAEFFDEDEEEEEIEDVEVSGFRGKIKAYFRNKLKEWEMFLTLAFSLVLSVGIFMVLPNIITSFIGRNLDSSVGLNLIEGFIRIVIFLLYVVWVAKVEDVKRVFEYHGAEHKSIHCYESGDELTVENVRKHSILHPRCGTSFLFMVMIISVLVLSVFGWPNPLLRILIRVLMFPVIAGITYEVNRLIGRSNSKFSYILAYPGLMIQKYATVKEPDDEQIQVAIESLKAVIPDEKGLDSW